MNKSCDSTSSCDTSSSCETQTCETQSCDSQAQSCPIECVADMWKGSFFQAMRQAQVEVLKTKIQKAWGPMMEQTADALIESMGVCWDSKMAQVRAAEATHGFKEKLRDILMETKKK